MKIYRLEIENPDRGCLVTWHYSKKEAEVHRAKEGAPADAIRLVIFPINKREVVRWLNANFGHR